MRSLLREQRSVQGTKERFRPIAAYESYFFKAGIPRGKREFTTFDLLNSAVDIPVSRRTSLRRFLKALANSRGGQASWTDAGAGLAVCHRQLRHDGTDRDYGLRLTSVDLFDWARLHARDMKEILREHQLPPDLFAPRFNPQLVFGDMTTATPDAQDLVSAVESLQYVSDKFSALSDWYNKLNDGGLLWVVGAHDLNQNFARVDGDDGSSLLSRFFGELRGHGVRFALNGDFSSKLRGFTIQKRAGTRMTLAIGGFQTATTGRFGYKKSIYKVSNDQPLISIQGP